MPFRRLLPAGLLALLLTFALPNSAEAAGLLMFEEEGCPYCEAWKEEIGPVYPKTPWGDTYPLSTHSIFEEPPEGVTLKSPPMISPTFILVDDQGQEFGRILGYPGEDFFWWFLEEQAKKAPNAAKAPSLSPPK